MYFVVIANAFDKSVEYISVHCSKGLAEARAKQERDRVKNSSEWVKVIKLKEYRKLRGKGLVTSNP
jgi:hypothetical protein